MLGNSLGIAIEVVCEIESAISGQLIESVDLAFARFQCSTHVFLWKILKSHPARLQLGDRQIVKFGVAQFARVFTIQPMEFVGIERGRAASDIFQIKDPDDLVDIDLLAIIFWRPAKQTKIISNRSRK